MGSLLFTIILEPALQERIFYRFVALNHVSRWVLKALKTTAKKVLGVDYHETSKDGVITLEPVYCLGNCACSPSVMMNDKVIGRVTPEKIDNIIKAVKQS